MCYMSLPLAFMATVGFPFWVLTKIFDDAQNAIVKPVQRDNPTRFAATDLAQSAVIAVTCTPRELSPVWFAYIVLGALCGPLFGVILSLDTFRGRPWRWLAAGCVCLWVAYTVGAVAQVGRAECLHWSEGGRWIGAGRDSLLLMP